MPKGNGNLCLPSKITSYMLSGKPILASVDNDSATTRYIQKVDCGITVSPDDVESFKNGVLSFSKMKKEIIENKGCNALLFSRGHLTREVNLKMVVEKNR